MEVIKQFPKAIDKAVVFLKKGGVVICPTDTVYGFLADASNRKAVDKIYRIKQRPKLKPLPVFVKDVITAKSLAKINDGQIKVLKKYWPGKYTFVLKRKIGEKLYGVDKDTIALRIPKYQFLNDVLKKINKPLVQTSVNISTQDSFKNIDDILAMFGKNRLVGLIIDAGSLKKSSPSKIIDLTTKKVVRLR